MASKDDRTISSIVEMSYRIDLPAPEWQQILTNLAFDAAGGQLGLISYEFDASDRDSPPKRLGSLAMAGEVRAFLEETDPVGQELQGRWFQLLMQGASCTCVTFTVSEKLQNLGLRVADFPPLESRFRRLGFRDLLLSWAVRAPGAALAFAQPLTQARLLSATEAARWERLGNHVACGYRLRSELAGTAPLHRAAAVFRPDGRPEQLDGATAARREALSHLVRSIDKARAADFRRGTASVVDLWKGLIDGRWILFDHVDLDGKRYILLVDGRDGLSKMRSLSPKERAVARAVAENRTNKEIAFELGIGLPSVATYLSRALAKLGVSSRRDLQAVYAALKSAEGSGTGDGSISER
ncbi:MAG: response regulator transcription factor [Spirochaetaceae bacterium]